LKVAEVGLPLIVDEINLVLFQERGNCGNAA
jgi:hypothetical protein